MSRLARSCRDWYQLPEVCGLFATLIGDCDGVYDPADYNDRLLLGLKGTMSEAELYLIKQRMLAGKRAKAKRGELGRALPRGDIHHPSGEVAKDPDPHPQVVKIQSAPTGLGAVYRNGTQDKNFHARLVKGSRNLWLSALLCRDLYALLQIYRLRSARSGNRLAAVHEENCIRPGIRTRLSGACLPSDMDGSSFWTRRTRISGRRQSCCNAWRQRDIASGEQSRFVGRCAA